jgi:hypothetical protein
LLVRPKGPALAMTVALEADPALRRLAGLHRERVAEEGAWRARTGADRECFKAELAEHGARTGACS